MDHSCDDLEPLTCGPCAERGTVMVMELRSRQDLSGGYLFSEQEILVCGLRASEALLPALPGLMQDTYFRHVQRWTGGMIRYRHTDRGVALTLFDLWPALSFHPSQTTAEVHDVARLWTIGPGFLARPREISFGLLVLRGEIVEGEPWRFTARVEGYPSRFLTGSRGRGGSWIRRAMGGVYAAWHRRVTYGYLRRLALRLREEIE